MQEVGGQVGNHPEHHVKLEFREAFGILAEGDEAGVCRQIEPPAERQAQRLQDAGHPVAQTDGIEQRLEIGDPQRTRLGKGHALPALAPHRGQRGEQRAQVRHQRRHGADQPEQSRRQRLQLRFAGFVINLGGRQPVAVAGGAEKRPIAQVGARAETAPGFGARVEPVQRLAAEVFGDQPPHLASRFVTAIDAAGFGAQRFDGEAQHIGLQFGKARFERRSARRQGVVAVALVAFGQRKGAVEQPRHLRHRVGCAQRHRRRSQPRCHLGGERLP